MDNSPSWDGPLESVPEVSHEHLRRRDTATVAAPQRPTDREYRKYLGIVKALRDRRWDTERQQRDSPFAVEDPGLTAVTARAADDLAGVASLIGADASSAQRVGQQMRAGLRALWDDEQGWFRPYDVKASAPTGPVTAAGLLALWSGAPSEAQAERIATRLRSWDDALQAVAPTTDPNARQFEPERYWRGPVWVIVNWMAADGLSAYGYIDEAAALRAATRALVTRFGYCEYYNPVSAQGIGGQGFSWTAALTLAWLTADQS
jgi:glycogen debranching enzyme